MRQGIDHRIVLQAASTLADEEGYEQVTLANIAKLLHIRTPSLYNHIKGLPELRRQLAVYGLTQLLAELTQAALGRAGHEAVQAIAAAYVNFVRQHPGLYEATMASPHPLDEEFHTVGNRIIALILRLLEPFNLNHDDQIHAVRGLRSLLHGYASLELKQQFNLAVDRDQSLRYIVTAYLDGIPVTK